MQTYTLKEMAASIDKADGYSGFAEASFHNQLRNLHAKGLLKPLSIAKRGPALVARNLVLFDEVGFAKARIYTKLVQLGIESNILSNIALLIDDADLSAALSKPSKKAYLNLALACDTDTGDTNIFGQIHATPNDFGAQIGDRELQLMLSLPLHTLFKGLLDGVQK